jgi:hypothetical protein
MLALLIEPQAEVAPALLANSSGDRRALVEGCRHCAAADSVQQPIPGRELAPARLGA